MSVFWLLFPPDPAPGLTHSKARARNLECERMAAEAAAERYPGRISVQGGRTDGTEQSAVVCRERLIRLGVRAPLDEAILSTLDATATRLAGAAGSLRPDLAGRTWLVEAYYPAGPVATKIAFATKNALLAQGLAVSDRKPTLAASDVEVLSRTPPDQAYPTACAHYFASGSLGEGDTLLAVVHRDPRETVLHAGLCTDGQWTWVR